MEYPEPGAVDPGQPSAPASPEPGYAPPPSAPEPGQAGSVPGAPADSTESGGQPVDAAQVRAAQERAQQLEYENQQFRQAWGELQNRMAQAEAQAQEEQIRSQTQAQIEQLYRNAADMDPETGFAYVRRGEDQIRLTYQQRVEQERQRGEQRAWEIASHFAGPLYAREQAKRLGLSEEYGELLAGVRAEHIDELLPFVKTLDEQKRQTKEQLEQLGRSARAGEMTASGAFNAGGNGASPVPPNLGGTLDPSSPNYDDRDLLSVITRSIKARIPQR